MTIGIRIFDGNDKFNITLNNISDYTADATLESDIVSYIKTRATSVPGVGTIVAKETVEVTTNI